MKKAANSSKKVDDRNTDSHIRACEDISILPVGDIFGRIILNIHLMWGRRYIGGAIIPCRTGGSSGLIANV
jgi:hypothetical protein